MPSSSSHDQRRIDVSAAPHHVSPPVPALREIGGRIQKLTYSELVTLAGLVRTFSAYLEQGRSWEDVLLKVSKSLAVATEDDLMTS